MVNENQFEPVECRGAFQGICKLSSVIVKAAAFGPIVIGKRRQSENGRVVASPMHSIRRTVGIMFLQTPLDLRSYIVNHLRSDGSLMWEDRITKKLSVLLCRPPSISLGVEQCSQLSVLEQLLHVETSALTE
jgi:hypothetical protein